MTSPGTTRSTKLSIVQVIDFPLLANCRVSPFSTHMNVCVLSKAYEAMESLAFHRVIALLRTDREQWTYDLPCLWRLHRRIKRSWMFGLNLHIFSPNSTLRCWYSLLVVRFPQVVVPQNWVRKDFDHEVHLKGQCLQIALFSFPNWILYQVHPENFMVCPAEAFNPIFFNFQ